MNENNKYLKDYISVEKIKNNHINDYLLQIMRYKAEQIRRYVDSVDRELFNGGIVSNITTKILYETSGIDLIIHFDVISVHLDKIHDLEKRANRYNKRIYDQAEDLIYFNENNNSDKHE